MKKTLSFIIVALVFLLSHTPVVATEVAATSAQFISYGRDPADDRADRINTYLAKHNSPIAGKGQYIVDVADEYSIPWTWVTAISGTESTFCKAIPYNSYNCYGWNNGKFAFQSWEDGIEVVTRSLKYNYVDKGIDTVGEISHVYAPPSTTWAAKVNFFISEIEKTSPVATSNLPISI